MLLKSSSEASLGLSGVDLSTRAYGISYTTFACFSMGKGSLTLVNMDGKVGPDLMMLYIVPARLSDPLTNACYVR